MNRYTIEMLLGKVEEMREAFQVVMDAEEPDAEDLKNKLDDFAEQCKEVGNYAYKESEENNMMYSLACGADCMYSMIEQTGFENDYESLLSNTIKGFLAYAALVLEYALSVFSIQ